MSRYRASPWRVLILLVRENVIQACWVVANLGVKAGIDPQQICEDIRKALPVGSRKVPDQEIIDAVKKALADRGGFTPQKLAAPATLDGQAAIKRIISQGTIRNEDDIREISPIPIPENKRAALILFLKIRFRDGEHIFISNRMRSGIIGETICTREEWEHYLSHGTRTTTFYHH